MNLDGFVEHFERYEMKGHIDASHVMEAGEVCKSPLLQTAYKMGLKL